MIHGAKVVLSADNAAHGGSPTRHLGGLIMFELRKVLFVSLVLGAASFGVGCGDPCVSGCEDAKSCDGADTTVDCQKSCDDAKAAAETAGCSTEYDDLVSCASGVSDVCNPGDACNAEATAYVACAIGGTGGGTP